MPQPHPVVRSPFETALPFIDSYASRYLGLAEDGRLVLAVTDGSSYSAWHIDVQDETPIFKGRIDGKGMPLSAPTMGTYGLVLPVLDDSGVRYDDLSSGSFAEGAPCTSL